ncbi:MAG: glycine--tRNA ligase subunit beta [Gammaproteobacteria bacterium]|nr:glycine--tRNA ligase subunit beta [Gammaproteobacteria bacterium]
MSKRDLLIELGTEELPPKGLKNFAQSFHDNVVENLTKLELSFEDSEWLATPRRLAVRVTGLDEKQQDKIQDRQGPAVAAAFNNDGSPKPAAVGFAKSCGVEVEDLDRVSTDKGDRLAFQLKVSGQPTLELLEEVVKSSLAKLPMPKTMRWGNSDADFIRVPQWLLILFGKDVPNAEILELKAGRVSYGHRFHSPEAITIESPSSYDKQLMDAKVNVCLQARKALIRNQVESIGKELKANPVIEEDLLEEVAALVEWPVALYGKFDEEFLAVPAEALIATMQADQKYFHLVDSQSKLLPYFITVANIESKKPNSIVSGNERVIRPRLADAKFFFDTDKKHRLEEKQEKLKTILFQNKLGSLFDKSQRIKNLAGYLSNKVGADQSKAERAALLCKCDLMTSMVYEFPELQGIMGRYYAKNDNEPAEVAVAMDEIYMPRFSGDTLPASPTGIALALADRIDTLVGIFGINQPPTGAKDPFGLRRAALGIIRILVEKQLSLDIAELIDFSVKQFKDGSLVNNTTEEVVNFIQGRLGSWYSDKGYSSQVINAVSATGSVDLFDFNARILAVSEFNELDDADALAAANKRVGNILAKSDESEIAVSIDDTLFESDSEKTLNEMLVKLQQQVKELTEKRQYAEALKTLSQLRRPVDKFFDEVMVNADDARIKANRLKLLSMLRSLFLTIADISLLQK